MHFTQRQSYEPGRYTKRQGKLLFAAGALPARGASFEARRKACRKFRKLLRKADTEGIDLFTYLAQRSSKQARQKVFNKIKRIKPGDFVIYYGQVVEVLYKKGKKYFVKCMGWPVTGKVKIAYVPRSPLLVGQTKYVRCVNVTRKCGQAVQSLRNACMEQAEYYADRAKQTRSSWARLLAEEAAWSWAFLGVYGKLNKHGVPNPTMFTLCENIVEG